MSCTVRLTRYIYDSARIVTENLGSHATDTSYYRHIKFTHVTFKGSGDVTFPAGKPAVAAARKGIARGSKRWTRGEFPLLNRSIPGRGG
jgi:hypothetical protein